MGAISRSMNGVLMLVVAAFSCCLATHQGHRKLLFRAPDPMHPSRAAAKSGATGGLHDWGNGLRYNGVTALLDGSKTNGWFPSTAALLLQIPFARRICLPSQAVAV